MATFCSQYKDGRCLKGLHGGWPHRGVCLRACTEWDGPARGLGDQVHKLAMPIGRVLGHPCVDPETKRLKPAGKCAERQRRLNQRFPATDPLRRVGGG